MVLIVGDGGLVCGADAVISAFEAQFADRGFVDYVRETDMVELAADGRRAAESGRWTGRWNGGIEMSGVYMAAWDMGCKGSTTYRPNAVTGSVLSVSEKSDAAPQPDQGAEVVYLTEPLDRPATLEGAVRSGRRAAHALLGTGYHPAP